MKACVTLHHGMPWALAGGGSQPACAYSTTCSTVTKALTEQNCNPPTCQGNRGLLAVTRRASRAGRAMGWTWASWLVETSASGPPCSHSNVSSTCDTTFLLLLAVSLRKDL